MTSKVRNARLQLAERVLNEVLGGPILQGRLPRASRPGPNAGMRAARAAEFKQFLANRKFQSPRPGYESGSEALPGTGHKTPKRGSTSS